MKAVDCQGFAGGMTLGIVQSGWQLDGKRENVGGFGVPLVESNRHLLPGPWETEVGPPETWTPRNVEMVFGNPPCSGFSGLTVLVRSEKWKDKGAKAAINHCMWDLVQYAKKCEPETVVFESVQAAGKRAGRDLMVMLRDELGPEWTLTHVFHNARALGGHAMRKRYFFVASKHPFGVERVRPLEQKTLMEIIGDLVDVPLGWDSTPDGHYAIQNIHAKRVQEVLDAVDVPPDVGLVRVAKQHIAEGKPFPNAEWWAAKRPGPFDVMRWNGDKPPRVVAGGTPWLALHPTLPRFMTYRELARIIGFPDDWTLRAAEGRQANLNWLGKGVTVANGRWIGTWAKRSLEGSPGTITGEKIGDREYLVDLTNDWKDA